MMQAFPVSDLACERRRADAGLPGVSLEQTEVGAVQKETLRITSQEGETAIGRPCGTYITLTHPPPWEISPEDAETLTAMAVSALLSLSPPKTERLLVVGLGNRHLTADAIGCATAEKIHATRHLSLYEPRLFRDLSCREICVMVPGVLAQTGMEATDLVCAAVPLVRPDLVLAIDALAARSCARLGCTVQLSDTGIVPGSGIGNHRRALSQRELGVPVIAMGIPTVVDAAAITREVLEAGGMADLPAELEAALTERGRFFVSPKECDVAVETLSGILADAVNRAYGITFC